MSCRNNFTQVAGPQLRTLFAEPCMADFKSGEVHSVQQLYFHWRTH